MVPPGLDGVAEHNISFQNYVSSAGVTAASPRAARAAQLADLRRREIIEAAFDEFSERGYHETAIADIARRLEMGHGTFYRYFDNKRDIVEHVVDELVGRVLAALTGENAPGAARSLDEYREQVGRIADALYSLLDEDPRVMRMLLLQAAAVDRELSERVLRVFDDAARITAAYLEHGRERGFLRADVDADAVGRALVGLILGGVLDALRDPGDIAARDRYRDAAVALVFDGIA
jgi:AcrR family transcriptional regulator